MSRLPSRLRVGPIEFRFSGESARALRYTYWAYRDFFLPEGSDAVQPEPLATLPIHLLSQRPARPSRPPDFAAGRNWAAWDLDTQWLFCSGYYERARPRFACALAKDWSGAKLAVDGDGADAPLRYPIDQILTWGLLGRCGGLLVHGAATERDGTAMVFAGRSGAGKSTLSSLCLDAGWRILNDDRNIVYPRAGEWRVGGTPWHGSGCYAEHRDATLGAIYLLAQSPVDRIETIPCREARMELLDVSAIPWFEEDWSARTLAALERVTEQVPVHRFHFTKTSDAVKTLTES